MSKKLVIIFLILWLLILNFFNIKAYYYNYTWKILYDKELYIDSLKYFENAWNKEWIYNKWEWLYRQKKYIDSIKEFLSILDNEKNEINFRLNHNIGNNYYRISENKQNNENKIKYLEKSVEYYRNALKIKYDSETKDNLEFVLKEIKNQKKEEEKKEKDNNKWNKDNNKWNKKEEKKWQQDQQKEWQENKENKDWQEKQQWEWQKNNKDNKSNQQEEQWLWKEQDNWNNEKKSNKTNWEDSHNQSWNSQENDWISEEQEWVLKQYEEALKEEQKNNQDDFNKIYKENNSNDILDNFFNNSFFNNNLLNDNNWEKDW